MSGHGEKVRSGVVNSGGKVAVRKAEKLVVGGSKFPRRDGGRIEKVACSFCFLAIDSLRAQKSSQERTIPRQSLVGQKRCCC